MERTAEEVTKMAAKIKNNPSIVPKKQGMTGREEKRLIADDCLEAQVAGDDDSDDEEEEDEGSQTEEEVDEDGYVVYGAVKAEEYVIPEEKSKKKTKGGKLGEVAEDEDAVWSQEQQRSLEQALTQFQITFTLLVILMPMKSAFVCIDKDKLHTRSAHRTRIV